MEKLRQSFRPNDPKWQQFTDAGQRLRERVAALRESSTWQQFVDGGATLVPRLPFSLRGKSWLRRLPSPMIDLSALPDSEPSSSSGSSLRPWMVAMGLAIVGFLLWWTWAAWGEVVAKGYRRASAFGPWPVNPRRVQTREALVQAYEYLALSKLGLSARTCNHLAIAARLGNATDASQKRAAWSLAHAYEQARYAPMEEELSESIFEEARRDLSLLAGAAGR